MTAKEIATDTMHEIVTTCDIARPAVHWIDQAEAKINESLQVARTYRRSVLTVAKAISKAARVMGSRTYANGIDTAIDNVLTEWYAWGWMLPAEAAKYDAWCVSL